MASDRALGRAKKGVIGLVDLARSISNSLAIGVKDREEARVRDEVVLPTIEERQEELLCFYAHYENLVDALCNSAQYGPTLALESKYRIERDWMTKNYAPVRKFVVAYLRYDPEDAEQGIALWGRSADAFEALIAAENLQEFLKADDGSMISRINRSRQALNLYGEHLRQLACKA